ARDAVDKYFTKVSASPKLKAHGLEKLRQELLLEASQFYERFIREQADEPSLRFELGWANHYLASIKHDVGESTAAEVLYQRAISIFEELMQADTREPRYRDSLGVTYNRLGVVYILTGQKAKADAALQQSVAVLERLTREEPDVAKYQSSLGDT